MRAAHTLAGGPPGGRPSESFARVHRFASPHGLRYAANSTEPLGAPRWSTSQPAWVVHLSTGLDRPSLARPEGCRACRRLHRVLVRQASCKDRPLHRGVPGRPASRGAATGLSDLLADRWRAMRAARPVREYALPPALSALRQPRGVAPCVREAHRTRAGRREAGRPATNAGFRARMDAKRRVPPRAAGKDAPGRARRRA